MLVLFDIDGTLLASAGAGIGALERAGQRLFSRAFSCRTVSFAGRLDPLITADLFDANGIEPTEAARTAYREAYHEELDSVLSDGAALALPGTRELVDAIEQTEATLGLLTGNFEEAGRLKLQRCGFEPDRFEIRVWGDSAGTVDVTRSDLPPVAFKLHDERRGPIDPARVVIIGDTPHDVQCARDNGCRSIAVATGHSPIAELKGAGPGLAVETLEDTERLVAWILQ